MTKRLQHYGKIIKAAISLQDWLLVTSVYPVAIDIFEDTGYLSAEASRIERKMRGRRENHSSNFSLTARAIEK